MLAELSNEHQTLLAVTSTVFWTVGTLLAIASFAYMLMQLRSRQYNFLATGLGILLSLVTILVGMSADELSDAKTKESISSIEKTYGVTLDRESGALDKLSNGNTDVFFFFNYDQERPYAGTLIVDGDEAQLMVRSHGALIPAENFPFLRRFPVEPLPRPLPMPYESNTDPSVLPQNLTNPSFLPQDSGQRK